MIEIDVQSNEGTDSISPQNSGSITADSQNTDPHAVSVDVDLRALEQELEDLIAASEVTAKEEHPKEGAPISPVESSAPPKNHNFTEKNSPQKPSEEAIIEAKDSAGMEMWDVLLDVQTEKEELNTVDLNQTFQLNWDDHPLNEHMFLNDDVEDPFQEKSDGFFTTLAMIMEDGGDFFDDAPRDDSFVDDGYQFLEALFDD